MSTTKTTTANAALEAERLAAQAAEAIAKADAARERAEEAGRRAEAERQAAVAGIRRRRLDAYDYDALEAIKAARSRFAQTIQAGEPALLEFVDLQVALTRRYLVAVEAEVARAAVDPERPAIVTGGPTELVYADEVQKVLARIVANRVEDLRDEMQAELDAAGR